MEEADRAVALALQAEYDEEVAYSYFDEFKSYHAPMNGIELQLPNGRKPKSIVDNSLEVLDPNPDVRLLFQEFNAMFFWGKLSMVEVRWSPRMTLCAGLCCYEGRGGLCSIRLSKPLLQLRPRKDLVETLLHEMIHALLFITNNNKDHNAHGPEFCKHMKRINESSGSNITIYHSFHNEVAEMRQHWWRCQGPCQKQPPYWGFVRRAMNRAPSPRDLWWAEHQRKCGGTYIKVKEPENYGKKKPGKKPIVASGLSDITPYLSRGAAADDSKDCPKSDGSTGIKTAPVSPGHRLGGHTSMEMNNRGVPSTSRLLNSATESSDPVESRLPRDNKTQTCSQDCGSGVAVKPELADALLCTKVNGKQVTLQDSWGNLLATKRKSLFTSRYVHHGRTKISNAVPELVARMKRNGQKSVNAGAPAFKNTAPVVNFGKYVLSFQDSEDEHGELSSTENRLLWDNSPQKQSTKHEQVKVFRTRRNNSDAHTRAVKQELPSLAGDDDCKILCDVLKRPANAGSRLESVITHASATLSDDELQPEAHFLMKSESNDKEANRSPNSKQFTNSKRRFPASCDEDEAMREVWKKEVKAEGPVCKKIKCDILDNGPATDNDDLPQFIAAKFSDSSQKTKRSKSCSNPFSSREMELASVVQEACCPICDIKFSMATINRHIDDCLSVKAIRDSSFD